MLDKKYWMCLWTMLDDLGPTFFSKKMLDESSNQFKNSSDISLAFFMLDDVGCVFTHIQHAGPTFWKESCQFQLTLRQRMPHICSFLDCFSFRYFLATSCLD